MGYRLNRLDEPVFIAVSKPLLTEFGIHHRLESCAVFLFFVQKSVKKAKTIQMKVSRTCFGFPNRVVNCSHEK